LVTLYCKTCKQQVGMVEDGHSDADGRDHFCTVHVPSELHEMKDHQYEGARVEDKPTVRMTVKVDNSN